MKTIIAGSRTITDAVVVRAAIKESGFTITEVICGCAQGVDQIGGRWALVNDIPVRNMPADWQTYGKSAGHLRNALMASEADACIVVWDGQSKGSQSMINQAKLRNLKLFVKTI